MQPSSEDSSATMNEDGAGYGALVIDEPAEIPVREGPIHVPAGSTVTKVCPSCSVQSETEGAFCPSCGSAYDRSRSRSRRSLKLIGIVVAAVLILGGGATAVALTVGHNNEVAAQQKAAARATAAKEKADAAASAQQAADDAKRALREAGVTEVETSITKDAQGRVAAGTLDGPITKTSCTPLGGGSTDDLTALTTTFTCIAINKENTDGTEEGYSFSATKNWDSGSYTWHLGN